MNTFQKPIIVVVGPTASGKSALAIALAREINGEIISADSRQVYIGMDIGTGKVLRDKGARHPELVEGSGKNKTLPFYSEGILHHLIDIRNPKVDYNVSDFLTDAKRLIEDIEGRGKRVIICGGTTFWIEALVQGLPLPPVAPDKVFREKWGKKEAGELYGYLKRLDPERAKGIDRKNKVRLLRAIEIAKALGKVPVITRAEMPDASRYLFIGLNPPVEELNKKIRARFLDRMKSGMLQEVEKLNRGGLSYERMETFGLEYRSLTRFLQKKLTDEELYTELPYDIIHYAKRQRSSLRRLEKQGLQIHWVEDAAEALTLIKA